MSSAVLPVLILTFAVCRFTVFLAFYMPDDRVRHYRSRCAVYLVMEFTACLWAVSFAGGQNAVCLLFLIRTGLSVLFFYGGARYKGNRFWVTYSISDQAVGLAGALGMLWSLWFRESLRTACILVCLLCMMAAVAMIFFVRGFFVKALCCPDKGWGALGCILVLYNMFLLLFFYHRDGWDKESVRLAHPLIFILSVYLSLILILLMVYRMKTESERRTEEQEQQEIIWLAKMRVEQGERQYKDMMENIEKISIIRHDLSHHFRVIADYCNTRQYEKIQGYLEQINFKETAKQLDIYCANHAANVILGYYAREAGECGAEFSCAADLPDGVPKDEMDLSIILGNSLENALEACRKVTGKRSIDFKMRYSGGKLIISIENSYSGNLTEENGRPATEKKEEGHGLGLKSIGRVVDKYGGYLNHTSDNGKFRLQIVLNIADVV